MTFVKTTISLPENQHKFLKENGYSASRLFQNQVSKLMKLSESQDSWPKPSDEPLERGSNIE